MGVICRALFLVVFFCNAVAFANNWKSLQVNNNLIKCFQSLIQNEKAIAYTRNVRVSFKSETASNFRIRDVTNHLLAMEYNVKLAFDVSTAGVVLTSQYDIHTRVFLVDSFDSLKFLLTRQRKTSRDIQGLHQYYYIILIDAQPDQGVIAKILDFCLENFIVNVNLLVEDNNGEAITVYTYYPFTEESCRKSMPTIHNRFLDGKLEWDRQTFPRKVKNMWQCTVRAVVWQKPPFIFLEDKQVSGIDGNVLKFLAESMNFTLDVYESPGGLGTVMSNGTTKGAFRIVEDRQGDLMIGGAVYLKLRIEHFASTKNYFGASLETIVKRPRAYSSFEILLFPFDNRTWITFFIIYVGKPVIQILWKWIRKISIQPKTCSTNLLILSWLLSIMVLRSSYEGSIFKFLHNQPRRQVPQNFEEALEAGYKFMAKSTYYPSLEHIPGLPENFIPLEVSPEKLLDEFDKYEGNYGLINLGDFLTTVANDTKRCQRYEQIKEPILHHLICIYLTKFSFFTEELNHQIQMMISHGHMQKIYDTSVTDKLLKFQNIQTERVHQMKLKQILGAFQLLFVLLSFSLLCLLLEAASLKCIFLKRIVEYIQ